MGMNQTLLDLMMFGQSALFLVQVPKFIWMPFKNYGGNVVTKFVS